MAQVYDNTAMAKSEAEKINVFDALDRTNQNARKMVEIAELLRERLASILGPSSIEKMAPDYEKVCGSLISQRVMEIGDINHQTEAILGDILSRLDM